MVATTTRFRAADGAARLMQVELPGLVGLMRSRTPVTVAAVLCFVIT
jgi:hypothetical protein